MLTLLLVILVTAIVALSISLAVKSFSKTEKEEQLPVENPEVEKLTKVKKVKTQRKPSVKKQK